MARVDVSAQAVEEAALLYVVYAVWDMPTQ